MENLTTGFKFRSFSDNTIFEVISVDGDELKVSVDDGENLVEETWSVDSTQTAFDESVYVEYFEDEFGGDIE